MRGRSGRLFVVICTLLLLAISSSALLAAKRDQLGRNKIELRDYPGEGGDFTLTDLNGKPFSLQSTRGKVVLLFFGYTVCPDVCPTTLVEMKRVVAELGEKSKQIKVIFISIDPERDTAERLKEWLAFYDKRFLGLTGSPADIKNVAKMYRARYKKYNADSAAGYLLKHTSYVFLLDKSGVLRYKIPFNTPTEIIIGGIEKVL